MAPKTTWTKKMLMDLYRYKFEKKLGTKEISKKIGKSASATQLKLARIDWDEFITDPDLYLSGKESHNRKWTQAEMGLLYAYMEEGKSYGVVAEKINRGRISVERKAQTTDWKAWLAAVGNPEHPEEVFEGTDLEELTAQLVDALVVLSRRETDRLVNITEKEFRRKVNFESQPFPLSFSDIKIRAEKVLESMGLKNPEEIQLGEGTYVIVGDSHGKFTRTAMFNLLHQVNKTLNPKKIIHLGHILDDDNDISYNWGKFKNLLVVSKVEELHAIQDQRNKFNFNYDVVRGAITLGNDLVIMNQDLIADYVKTPLSSLDSEIFDQKAIVNCHRLEFFPKCSENKEVSYIASPGALCERHIIRTIKQIDFEDGKNVKQANWEGFSKYRRMKHMYQYWKQGLLVVHVDSNGMHTIVPCLIRKLGSDYATSYFDKIISNKGVHKPTKKIFITADSHSPKHCNKALDLQEQVVKDYKPDICVNLGDAADYGSLNHHIMDRGGVILGDVVSDASSVYHVLKRQSKWAKEIYIQHGNHERFANDFIEKFPQLKNLLNFEFLCSPKSLGYKLVDLKTPLKIGGATFIHGDMRMYGQTGSVLEKVSKTFGDSVFMGHSHYPAIRYGTYVIGLSGKLDQSYNEANASAWINGFGLCNQYKGKSWPCTLAISHFKININGKSYGVKNPENWDPKEYKVKMVFE